MCSRDLLCILCKGPTCANAASSAASTCRKYSFDIGSRLKNALQDCVYHYVSSVYRCTVCHTPYVLAIGVLRPDHKPTPTYTQLRTFELL
jgi:hypothetical protein